MPYAELRQQRVDGSDLNACATAGVPQLRSLDVILPVWADEWQGSEALDEILTRAGAGKTLKQLLQDGPRSHHNVVTRESIAQGSNLWDGGLLITPECKRPNAGVHEQRHSRDRSAL